MPLGMEIFLLSNAAIRHIRPQTMPYPTPFPTFASPAQRVKVR